MKMEMTRKLSSLIFAVSLFHAAAQQIEFSNPEGRTNLVSASRKLTNTDIIDLQRAGLSSDVITEKISSSPCDFDTSPPALTQLKNNGLSDSILLAMVRCRPTSVASPVPASNPTSNATPTSLEPAALSPNGSISAEGVKGYVVTYVKSDRRWKLGFRSEPYDKISDYFETQLTAALDKKGVHRMPVLDRGCFKLTLELLEVTSHPAMVKKPGVDVAANVLVTDSSGRLVYARGYRGESRTMMNTWGHLINHAVEELVKNISGDENFVRAISTGRP